MLLKIGKRFINLDNVISISDGKDYDENPRLLVYHNVNGGDSGSISPDCDRFMGDERLALLSYLDTMAVDVLAVYAEKNKPDCATCGDKGHTAIRNGDDSQDCPDCTKPDNNREIPY